MKPAAMLYCQHSLGLGHFVRSLALAEAISEAFDLTFLNGGPVPPGIPLPDGIRFEHLPPIRMDERGKISGCDDPAARLAQRRDRMLALADDLQPAVLVVELYPFGRKKFAVELDPLIDAVRGKGGKIVCSVRDVLVNARADQAKHDDRAASVLNATFDGVLVHADARIFDLGDTFPPAGQLSVPVFHTGYVARAPARSGAGEGTDATLVCAGGGAVGHPLYQAALDAQPRLMAERGWPMSLVAGPMFPDADWDELGRRARGVEGLTLLRSVPSLQPLLASAGRIVAQCGYNSALEILQARRPVLFAPFARGQECEQTLRAEKLASLGLAAWMPEAELSGSALAERLLRLPPLRARRSLDLNGARNSTALLKELTA